MKKTYVLTALAALAVLALAACGDSTAQTASQDTASGTEETTVAETEELDALEARKLVDDNLGEHDYGGKVFRICAYNGNTDWYVMEEQDGDVVDDAVYSRTQTVEERFNVDVQVVADDSYDVISKAIDQAVKAGDDCYDLIGLHVIESAKLALEGYYLNWYDIPSIDFSQPWWSDSTVNDLTYKGICYTAIGDMVASAIGKTYCTFYNTRIGADYDLDDPYQVVYDGKWTFDYVVDMCKDIYQDLNGDGKITDLEDLFGYCTSTRSSMDAYLWSFDNPIFQKNDDGTLEFVYVTDKIADIVDTLQQTFNKYDGVRASTEDMWGYGNDMFETSQCLLCNGVVNNSLQFREMTDDYYILPYPKWDEAQENYYTMVDGSHEVLSVPTTASDLEFIGVVTEAMNAEAYKQIVPAYYDVALKVKGTRDDRSVEMLDMILDSRVYDFGYVYDGWSGVSFFLENLYNSTQGFESYWASKQKAVTKQYDKVVAFFEEQAAQ